MLWELAQTPLMLSIMSLAFQGTGTNELVAQKGGSPEERRKQIFRLYVKKMFEREEKKMFERKEPISLPFPKRKTIGWLSWLAGKMRKRSEWVFLVEGLQPSWLDKRAERAAYGPVLASSLLIPALIFGQVIFGLIGGLSGRLMLGLMFGLMFGLMLGLMLGLFGGLIGGLIGGPLNHITLVETLNWKWNQFLKTAIRDSIGGMISALIFMLIFGLITGARLSTVLIQGVFWMLIFGLGRGLVRGFTHSVKEGKTSPNQGIKLSWKNSLAVFLATWLAFGLFSGLTVGLFSGLIWPTLGVLKGGLTFGLLFVGPFVGLIVGLNRGGSAVIKHYALRLILWRKGYTPFNFIKFLDHCDKLIFLKKVGGGYIFIHRMLLEYFAELDPRSKTGDGKLTGVSQRTR